jgi:site-specific recombinase
MSNSYLNNIITSEKRLLVAFTKYLRYLDNSEEAFNAGFNDIIELLKSDEKLANRFSFEVKSIFRLEGFCYVLSSSNIQLHGSFWQEFSSKVRAKILPKLNSTNAFKYRLQKLFNFDLDSQWLAKITKEQLRQLTDIAFSIKEENDNQIEEAVSIAIRLVSHKIAALGIENRMVIRYQNPLVHQNQFMQLPHSVDSFLEIYKSGIGAEQSKDNVRAHLDKLRRHLQDVLDASEIQGTDIQKTFLVSKTRQLIDRLENLCVCLQPGNQDADLAIHRIAQDIVEEEYSSQNFRGFFKSNLKTLSLRVSEHTSHTGEHYIASGLREYSKFLYAAIGAGFIVSILVFFKAWLHMTHLPLFWEAMVYSLNYVLGFVLIQVFHFTLATKQPAMTAPAMASKIKDIGVKDNEGGQAIEDFVDEVTHLVRSQVVAVFGNVLMVVPCVLLVNVLVAPLVALAMAWGFLCLLAASVSTTLAAGCGAGRALALGFKPGAKGGGAGFKTLVGLDSPFSGEAFLRLACLCMSKKLKAGSVSVTLMAASRGYVPEGVRCTPVLHNSASLTKACRSAACIR